MRKRVHQIVALVLVGIAVYCMVKKIDSPPATNSRASVSFGYTHVKGGFCKLEESQTKPVFLLISMQPRDLVGLKTETGKHFGIDFEIVSLRPSQGRPTDVRLGRVPTLIPVMPDGDVEFARCQIQSEDFEELQHLFSEAYEGIGPHNIHEFGIQPTIDAIDQFFSRDGRQWPPKLLDAVKQLHQKSGERSPKITGAPSRVVR